MTLINGYYASPIIVKDDAYNNDRSWSFYFGTGDINSITLASGISTTGLSADWGDNHLGWYDSWSNYGNLSSVAGIWSNVSFTYDGIVGRIYLNGTLVSEHNWNNATPGSLYHSDCLIKIGVGSYNNYFQGKIDDIRIYNRALSETEILELYNEADINNLPIIDRYISISDELYTEDASHESVFARISNLQNNIISPEDDDDYFLNNYANPQGAGIDNGTIVITHLLDNTWQDDLGNTWQNYLGHDHSSSFNTVYDASPGPDSTGTFEVVSVTDEGGSFRGTTNRNAYYFSYDGP